MIVGAAIIPSAPLLIPGVSATLPDGLDKVCDAVDAALESLPPRNTVVLLAAAQRGQGGSGQGLYEVTQASLAGVGRPDVACSFPIDHVAVERISRMTQYPIHRGDTLPLGLAALAILVGGAGPFVPMTVPPTAGFDALSATGTAIAEAFASWGEDERTAETRAVVIAAGDLSAGLEERSPLHLVHGARDWDARVVDVVDSGRLDGLARLGPAEATRVGALGWAPMAVLHGAMARAKIGLVRRHYAAPRGVGYLVAHGA